MRWVTRGLAAVGAVVVAWLGFSWARLNRERARAAADRAAYGSLRPVR